MRNLKISLDFEEGQELQDLLCNCLHSEDPFLNNRIAGIILERIEEAEDEFSR